MKKQVLIITSYYHPSVKGGGPIRSIKNLVDKLSDRIDFYIITGDRDLGDSKPFDCMKTESWTKVESATVFYTDRTNLNWRKYKQLIEEINCDVIYLNSFFSYRFSIIPILLNKMGKLKGKKIVLSPRGEFSQGALGLRSFKKKLYIQISKTFKLYDNIRWHATTEYEMKDIKKVFDERININIASNLTANYQNVSYSKSIIKYPGEVKLVYVSRIHPMKNLKQVLELIKNLDGQILFNIFGPIEDKQYWGKCKEIIMTMPSNIKVKYNGPIQNNKLNELYQKHHYFILLTLGENFGHAIAEALIGGCPVVISDRTPWKDLQTLRVGWDVSLENNNQILEALKDLIAQDNEEYQTMSRNAYEFSKKRSNEDEELNSYYNILAK